MKDLKNEEEVIKEMLSKKHEQQIIDIKKETKQEFDRKQHELDQKYATISKKN